MKKMTEYSISYRLVPTEMLYEASAELVNQMLVISKLQSALGTEETGDALIEVARNAHKTERATAAIVTYCEGVKGDFPQTNVWMDNIIKLARGE